jgi:hypothetical protein
MQFAPRLTSLLFNKAEQAALILVIVYIGLAERAAVSFE